MSEAVFNLCRLIFKAIFLIWRPYEDSQTREVDTLPRISGRIYHCTCGEKTYVDDGNHQCWWCGTRRAIPTDMLHCSCHRQPAQLKH